MLPAQDLGACYCCWIGAGAGPVNCQLWTNRWLGAYSSGKLIERFEITKAVTIDRNRAMQLLDYAHRKCARIGPGRL